MPSYLANLLFSVALPPSGNATSSAPEGRGTYYILGPLAVIAVVALVLTVILEGP